MAKNTGIEVRHQKACPTTTGGRCKCLPTYRARVYVGGKIVAQDTFPNESDAIKWRAKKALELAQNQRQAQDARTLNAHMEEFLAGIESGAILTRSDLPYKPSVVRSYRTSYDRHIRPHLGALSVSAIQTPDTYKLVGILRAEGLQNTTVRNAVMPLRVLYRHLRMLQIVTHDPVRDVPLPPPTRREWTVLEPDQIAALLAALSIRERTLWGLAFYAGLRRGELRGLRPIDIDLAERTINIRKDGGWDDEAGRIPVKTSKAKRELPIVDELLPILELWELERHVSSPDLDPAAPYVQARTGEPFTTSHVLKNAKAAWRQAKLEPVGLHEARHNFASFLLAAKDLEDKERQTLMGHADISTLYDIYGHARQGTAEKARKALNTFLNDNRQE